MLQSKSVCLETLCEWNIYNGICNVSMGDRPTVKMPWAAPPHIVYHRVIKYDFSSKRTKNYLAIEGPGR